MVCPDNGDVKPIRLLFVAGLFWSYALAGETACPADAPAVDPSVKVDAEQDSALSGFDKQVAIVAAKPKAEGIDELSGTVRRLADLENKSMSSAFHLTSGNSVRSLPSAELEAHLEAMKAFKRAQELLDEAKDAANAHVPHVAQLRIAAAAKELAKARQHVAAKRKARPKKKGK